VVNARAIARRRRRMRARASASVLELNARGMRMREERTKSERGKGKTRARARRTDVEDTNGEASRARARAVVVDATTDAERSWKVTLTGAMRDAICHRIEFRYVIIRGEAVLQETRMEGKQARCVNHATAKARREAVEKALDDGFRHWRVERENEAWCATVNERTGEVKTSRDLSGMKVIDGKQKTRVVVVGPTSHDREKARAVKGDEPFLRALGLANVDGTIKANKRDKYKQVEEFVKILEKAHDEAATTGKAERGSASRPLRVCDLGCGNAYLTFAAYALLANAREIPTRVIGVDVKSQAREHNAAVAAELGWDECVRFVEGTIASAEVNFVKGDGEACADIVLALHACDTATDEAIVRTVRWRSPLALIAPCCHHDLQVRLKKSDVKAFPPLMRHGILSERFGDVLTDAFRAHVLRLLGYRVDVQEFVGGEHTPRNTLIRAIRTGSAASKEAWEEYDAMRDTWGVTPWLAEALAAELAEARAAVSSRSRSAL